MAIPYAENERALIDRAQGGDHHAYGELVRRHHGGVVNVVYRMCGDVDLAQDAAQEAFLQAWRHLPSFRPGTSLRNWLYRIAVNAALDVLRRNTRLIDADLEALSLPDLQPDPETALVRHERAAAVQSAILGLTDASRAVFVLRESGGLSYQEIATALDIPLGTVMSRLNYARTRLRQLLEPHFVQMEPEDV